MFFNFRDRQVINCHFGCWIINIFLGFTLSVFSKCAIANSLSSSDSGHSKVLRVAVTQCEDHLDYREIIANFLDVVKTSISADMQIDIRYLDINAIDKSVRDGSIDIFLANSAMFRTLTSAGVKDLATVITDRTPNPNEGDGATWIVRSERHDLQAPQDLAGRSVSAKAENSLAGWYFALGELIYDGINPDNFFIVQNSLGGIRMRLSKMYSMAEQMRAYCPLAIWRSTQRRIRKFEVSLKLLGLNHRVAFRVLYQLAFIPTGLL